MKRREFMKASAVAMVAVPSPSLAADQRPDLPLKAELRLHELHLEPRQDGRFILLGGGPLSPRKLIRPEALARAFGKGTCEAIVQPDHWAMIEAGWFGEDDLYMPDDFDDPQYRIWYANYRPECEAHDLLYDLFRDSLEGFFFRSLPSLGLDFAEHPCSPRLATVKLDHESFIQPLITAVEAQTKWIVINPDPRRPGDTDGIEPI